MKVMVTGATGFVGSHTTAALQRHGHRLRVLARRPERVPAVLEPLDVDLRDLEIVAGDMTDGEAVARALDGCEAVVHAAAEIAVAGGRGPAGEVNLLGVRQVIGQAVSAALDPIVYTSSVAVHLPAPAAPLTAESPFAEPLSAYGRAKLEAERLVQDWQTQGAAITTVVLGSIYGPVSPHVDGSFGALIGALTSFMALSEGGMGIVDVRDAAELLARSVVAGRGPRRYMAGGHFLDWATWTETLSVAVGRPVSIQEFTTAEMIDLGRELDRLRELGPVEVPLSEEAAVIMTSGVPTDDRRIAADLGVRYRPTIETFRDAVAWLVSSGHLEATVVSRSPTGR